MKYELIIIIVFCSWLFLMSFIAFVLYGKDKKLAMKNQIRIKEKTLLGVTALGGAVGALIGRILFRHKTDKKYFSLTIYFSLIVELATLGIMLYFGLR